MNHPLHKFLLITALLFTTQLSWAQKRYQDLSFYRKSLTSQIAKQKFIEEIKSSINNSTPEGIQIAKLYLEYAIDQNDSDLILSANYELGVVYYKTSKLDSSIYFISKASEYCQRIQDSAMLVEIYRAQGASFFSLKQNEKAIEYFNYSYDIAYLLNDSVGMAKSLNNLSLVSANLGEYEDALNYLKRSLDIKIAFAPKKERISTLLNIGTNYAKLGNYDKALEYFHLAENIAIEFNETQRLSQLWLEFALIYVQLKDFPNAEKYFIKSLELSESISDNGQLYLTLKAYAEYWMFVSQWEKAKENLNIILDDLPNIKDDRQLCEVYFDLGKIEFKQNKFSSSEKWLNKSLSRAKQENGDTKAQAYKLLSLIAYHNEMYKTGYDFLQLSNEIADSIHTSDNFDKLQELQIKYKSTSDKKYIDHLVELTELKEQERKKSNQYAIIATVILLITLVATVSLAIQMQINRKKSIRLKSEIRENTKKTQELIAANLQAQEGLRVKSEFIAMVSHEIRTPMNAIIGMSSLLSDTELNKQQKNYLSNISISSNNLLILLNDILDFSRVESGKITIKFSQTSLKQDLEHIVQMFTPLAAEQKLDFRIAIDSALPDIVFVDAPRLRQVLVNLLSNAIKFTHTGFIKLSVKVMNTEHTLNGEKVTFRFAIEDSGIGVPAAKQKEIFSSFMQIDSKVSRQYTGVGLGLSISQGIIGMMGSTIQLESEFAKGSKFWFDLSLKSKKSDGKPLVSQSSKSKVKFDKELGTNFPLRILVAEDNEINQKLIQINLNKMGYNPTIVNNGQEALDQIKQNKFDLIFMDVQMPVMDGVTATKEIVRKYGNAKPIIIAVTANAMGNDKQSYITAGMDDYISKPFTAKEIEACLRNWYVHING